MDPSELTLSDGDFARVKTRLRRTAGIALNDSKHVLVVSRLGRLLRSLGFGSFAQYLDYLDHAGEAKDEEDFVNALTTNLTRFWREEHHFTHLLEQLPTVLERRAAETRLGARPRLRIWSAGCSTGQEAYSIALTLLAGFPQLDRWDFRLLGTDIDTSAIARAIQGTYPATELHGLPPERARLLEQRPDGRVEVPAEIRRFVTFKALNLIGEWPMKGPFDAIFCRNVAIYFDRANQKRLFCRLGSMLRDDGYLYIGHSEVIADELAFQPIGKTIYQRRAVSQLRRRA